MKTEEIQLVKEKISKINKTQLKSFNRFGSVADIGFGELVTKNIKSFDDERKIITKTIEIPKYSLHIDCHFRLSCGSEIILSRGDIFQPSNKVIVDQYLELETFDWDIKDNNKFDEICNKYFHNVTMNFEVKKIVISKLGDLKISFENNFLLEISPDISGNQECWRFFEQNSENHLIVSGLGIEND